MPTSAEQVESDVEPPGHSLPGDVGFWTFIAADATLFALLFYQFSLDRSSHASLFHTGQQTLLLPLAMTNTLVLVSSSWFAAMGVRCLCQGERRRASWFVLGVVALGLVFTGIKISEYVREIDGGHTISTSNFFMYYFIITGIHLGHLLVGVVAMVVIGLRLRSTSADPRDQVFMESIASYWHLVDMLWLFIFPLLYLAG